MTGEDLGQLAYLALLLAAVGGYVVTSVLRSPGQAMRHGAVWMLIFLGAIAVAGLWGDIQNAIQPQPKVTGAGRIEVPLGYDGHFHLTADVNGAPVKFVVDTGASQLVLTQKDAARAGLNPDDLAYFQSARTANGTVQTAPVTLDEVQIGPFTDAHVAAVVNGGEMDRSLMGMSYLATFARVEFSGDQLVLER